MEYNIYLDVFFLVNFILNGVVLLAAGWILRRQFSWKRLILSSAVGAVVNVFSLVLNIDLNIALAGLPFMSAVFMGRICFGKGTGKETLLSGFLLYFMAFCLEGGMEWLNTWGGSVHEKKYIGLGLSSLFLLTISRLTGKERKKQEEEMKVVLTFKGRKKELQGFYDSGNRLSEALTGKMVHIACYDDVKELLPAPYQEVAETYFKTGFFENTKVTKLQMYEFTFLSYHSIGKETGQLLGIRMDSAVFENHAGKKTEDRPVIGLADQKLFVRGQGRMIINGRLEL